MSFVLRQITRRTGGGGEIVRTRELTADEPVIGRGADADIQLSDLALSLQHARLRKMRPGRVEVLALGAAGFVAKGEEVTRTQLDLAASPTLGFGAYRLTFTEEGGNVVVTVAHDEDADAGGEFDETVFALSASVFSKRRLAWGLALLVLIVGLAWPIAGYFAGREKIDGDAQWSSGPLSKAHAFLEDDCQACHVKAFVSVRDTACMQCHAANRGPAVLTKVAAEVKALGSPDAPRFVTTHAEPVRLLHGTPTPHGLGGMIEASARKLFSRPDDRCGGCHVEHQTAKDKVPTVVAPNGCADCHGSLTARLRDTDLPNVESWKKHPDFRPLVTVSPAKPVVRRIPIADHPRESSGLIFPHDVHVSPTGGPARMAQTLARYGAPLDCADCHRPDKSKRNFAPVEMERDCGACHSIGYVRVGGEVKDLPHGDVDKVLAALRAWYGTEHVTARPRPGEVAEARRAREAAALAAIPSEAVKRVRGAFSPGGTCVDCHTVTAPADGSLNYRVAPVHLTARFMPRGAFDHSVPEHRKDAKGKAMCADCHATETSKTSADLLLSPIRTCSACHGKTEKEAHAPGRTDCEECHSYHAPGVPTPERYYGPFGKGPSVGNGISN